MQIETLQRSAMLLAGVFSLWMCIVSFYSIRLTAKIQKNAAAWRIYYIIAAMNIATTTFLVIVFLILFLVKITPA